jgi:RHS repeat-associated protein
VRSPFGSLGILAPLAVLLVACQSAGDISIQTAAGQSPVAAVGPSMPGDSVLNMMQMADSNQVGLQFSSGTSYSAARLIGQGYGLELIDGPLSSGPWRSGFYIFQIPKVLVQAITPTTANVYFPSFSTVADRKAYLDQNNLRLVRWVRSELGAVALVQLPPANLYPETIDPVQGLFRITLPAGLDQQAVVDWAITVGLGVVGYDSSSGLTVVHPDGWAQPAPGPVAYFSPQQSQPVQTPPALASPDRLFVQFAASLSLVDINAAAQKIGLTVVSVTATNLATLSGDPSKIKAEIQLLSDLATVQCVSASQNPCTSAVSPPSASTSGPAPEFGQPSTLSVQLKDGILRLDWPTANGATAYAIFGASASTGSYQMIAIVAGQTSYLVSELIPPGATEYFQVIALHPCNMPTDATACDIAAPVVSGIGGAEANWTNPVSQTLVGAQTVTGPTPTTSSPAATVETTQPPAQPSAAPSQPAPTPDVTAAISQPTPSPQPSAAPSQPAPSPAASSASPQPTPAPVSQVPAISSPPAPPPFTSSAIPQSSPQATPVAQPPAAPSPPSPSPAAPGATSQPTPVSQSPTAASIPTTATPSAPSPAPANPEPTSTQAIQVAAQTSAGPTPLVPPVGVSASPGNGHMTVTWQPVTGASSYRLYRGTAGGVASYIATTSDSMFVDTGGSAGDTYSYVVAAIAGSGLVGTLSGPATTTWQAATSTPTIVRSLPTESGVLAGRVRLQIEATSGDGRGSVAWSASGPAAALTIGSAPGQPIAEAALSWSAALTWDTTSVPDGTYTINATVTDASGNAATSSSTYRIQNAAPAAPTSLSAVSQPSGIALTWEQPASEAAAFYRLFRDQPSSSTPLIELSADSRAFTDTSAQPGAHHYVLLLVDSAGHASSPANVDVSASAPVNQLASAELDLQVLLPTGQPLAADGRVTDRLILITPSVPGLSFQLSSDGQTWTTIAQDPACAEVCTLELTLESLAVGPHSVRAITSSLVSPVHNFVRAEAVRYQPPTGLTAVHNGLGVALSWSAPLAALPASYQVARQVAGGDWQLLDSVAATNYIDGAAPAGVMVNYRVNAIDPEGISGLASAEATIEVPVTELAEQALQGAPRAPTHVKAFAGNGRATLDWDSVPGASGFLVERQLQSDGPFAVAGVTGADTFADAPVNAVGQVTYRVLSLNGVIQGPPSAVAKTLVIPNRLPPALPSAEPAGATSPSAPSAPKASVQGDLVQLSWTPPDGAVSATYSVYLFDPGTGAFGLAASRLETPSFVDSSLTPGAGYGYVVTATAPGGSESSFSDPVWANFPADASLLSVEIVAPGPSESLVRSPILQALAKVTAAAGLSGISFEIAPAGGLWTELPAGPLDPRTPLPMPAIGVAGPGLWGSTLNTTTLAPGTYKLRVRVTDRAGRAQERIQDLVVPGPDARGPPSSGLTASGIPGGVHLSWTWGAPSYMVERSIFGVNGPFEPVATTQAQQYDDHSAINGQSYTYRVRSTGGTQTSTNSASASALGWPVDSAGSAASIQLGTVAQSELSVTVSAITTAHPLTSGLRQVGSAYDINAASLASGHQVHRLGESAQIDFILPPGLSSDDAAAAAIYHWDEAQGAWAKEPSSVVDPSQFLVDATVDHLSAFVVAVAPPLAGGGSLAQPPASPTDPTASQSGQPYHVAADGEVISMRTANARVYRDPDGRFRQVISSGMVNYQDANGQWQKIDTTLVPAGTTSTYVENAAGPLQLQLPSDLSTSPVVVVTAAGTTSFTIEGAASVARVVNGSDATYQDVLSGVTIDYSVIPEGLKESLIIATKPVQAPVFAFRLSTGSLALHELANGTVQAVNSSGQVQFTINAPWMHDAPSTQSPEGATSTNIAVSLTGGSGSYGLTYTPDPGWLNDQARRYPVTVDPSLTYSYAYGGEYDSQINNCSPDYNYQSFSYLPIGATPFNMGNYWCYGASRAMTYFYMPASGTVANYAQLGLYQYANTNGGGSPIYAEAATTSWSANGVTWTNANQYTTCNFGCSSANTLNGTGWVYWNVTSIVQAWETKAFPMYGFAMVGNENGCSPACNEEFFASDNYSTTSWRPQLTIWWYDESGTIAWQGVPHTIAATAGSLVSVPITVTNTANAVGGSLTWHAYNHSDLVRVGIRDYRAASGAVLPIPNLPNLRSYLPADVAPGGFATLNAVVQVPGDPGDYLLRFDLVRETLAATTWFADRGNQPLEVRVRVVAPGDGKTTQVPVALGDGSSLGVSTSNGFASLTTTDINIGERGGASLHVSRAYNGVNGLVPGTATGDTNATYGLGWTFDFQRSVHLGSLAANTYDPTSGILTDANGQAWTLSWNAARGLFEDAAGNRTVAPSTATVTTATGTLTIPTRPVDLINGSAAVLADSTAPGGYALRMEGTSGAPTTLIMPPGSVPAQQNGTIEFWFRPNFDMSTDSACHVFFADAQLRFGLAWNCSSGSYSWGSGIARAIDFFTYDSDTGAYNILSSAAITWTAASGWHHISLTWAEGGAKQLMTDTTLVSNSTHAQSPIADLIFGYQPNGNASALNYLNGRVTQLRIEGKAEDSGTLSTDSQPGATVSATQWTLYLGHYDSGSAQSSATTYLLRNPDQSTETYSALGVLQNEADRLGNQVDYSWDSSGRIQTISDHSIAGRNISFAYGSGSFTATDLGGRTVTYQLNGSSDLVSVTKSNQVPDPRTGTFSAQNTTTSYAYATGHLLQQVTDPRGAKTTLNYDQSYRQVVMVDNPTAYWRMGETSGSSAADTAGSFTGTLNGGITLGQGGAAWGDSNLAYKFDGSSGYVQIAYAGALNPSALSVEAWAMITGGQGTRRAIVSTVFPGSGNYTGFELAANTANQWIAQVGVGTGSWGVITGPALVLNQWTYLVAAYASGTLSLYVNGSLQGTLATAYAVNSSRELDLGADYYSGALGGYLAGKLGEVALTPVALSPARIQAHFAAGRLGIAANAYGYAAQVALDSPLAYWRLGESAGTRAYDQSGSSNNATYSGGYWPGQPGALTTDAATSTSFDGSSGYAAALPIGSLSRWSLEAWINPGGNQGQDTGVISDVYSTVVNYALFFNYSGSTPLGLVTGFYDSGGWHLTPAVNVVAGSWSHVVGSFDGSTIRLYIDGQLESSLSYTASSTSNGIGLRIGRRWDSASDFAGRIEDAAVYGGALDASRIMAHYLAGRAAGPTGSPYLAAIPADKPAGYWRLGETAGTLAADSSGSGITGTYTGGFILGQAGAVASDPGYSASFNGSTGYVNIGNPTVLQFANGTIEAWVSTTTTSQSAIVAKLYAWWFGIQPNGNVGLYDMTAHVMRDSGVAVNDGRWHLVAVTFQSGVASGSQFYVDGQPAGAAFQMTVSAQSNIVEIAGYETTAQFLNGRAQEVALYPTVLGQARLRAHFQAGRLAPIPITGSTVGTYSGTVLASSPLGYWRLDEASGTTALDKSGSNNPGTYSSSGVQLNQAGSVATDLATAAKFDGFAGSVAVAASSSLNVGGPMTIEAWINKSSQTIGPIVEYNNGSAYGVQFWNYATWDSLFVNFFDTTGTSHVLYSAAGLFKTGIWYHVAAVYDGSYGSLYVNGVLVARTYMGAFTPQTSYQLYIAKRPNTAYFFAGTIDDVAVYAGALTASTILSQYNAAWDPTRVRVASVQDARGTTSERFYYNDDAAITQVFDGRGLPSYYTFQQYGGRTLSVTDTGNNVTSYQYDGGAPYRLIATVSPSGIRHSQVMNSGAPVGQQGQILMVDDSAQPSPTASLLMSGGYPDPSIYGTAAPGAANESWIWDSSVTIQPGVVSHRSTPYAGMHQHYVTFSTGVLIPAGATISQWVYIEPGAQPPGELELQFDANDSTTWLHRAWWGSYDLIFGTGNSCPSNCNQSTQLPVAGRWALLTVAMGPAQGAVSGLDVGMTGRTMVGLAFTLYGGAGAVWWGPTTLQMPGAAVTDPTRAVSSFAYNQTNDVIASVDPNAIATIADVNSAGEGLQKVTGVELHSLRSISYNAVSWSFESTNSNASNSGMVQTHIAAGLQSDLYQDFSPTTFHVGMPLQVSVTVSTSGSGAGGAVLVVDDSPNSPGGNGPRRTAAIQTGGAALTLTLPFVVDESRTVRVRLWQENFVGTTSWSGLTLNDITPVPDSTVQGSTTVYGTDFEQPTDRASWSTTVGLTGGMLHDQTNAHGGQWSAHQSLAASTGDSHFYRSGSVLAYADYQLSAWVRTVTSGSHGGTGGASLIVTPTESNNTPLGSSAVVQTEGQWQLIQVTFNSGGTNAVNLRLDQNNFQGDAYFDDLTLVNLNDSETVMNWSWSDPGSVPIQSVHNLASGGLAGGGSRQIVMTAASALVSDVQDALQTPPLRNGATYVISVWAASTAAGGTIDLSLRDGSKNVIPMDHSSTCSVGTALTLCQNSVTWNGTDKAVGYLLLMYGGGTSARTITIAHPLIALDSQLSTYTQYGQLTRSSDIFGHSTTTALDSNSLYPTQTVVTATPSPSLTTNYSFNQLGQLILSTRVNGGQSIAQQLWLDSWGRQVGLVQNCVTAVAPPGLCNATANSSTNVMTRYTYDLNGNLTDRFDQAPVSGNWIDTHYLYDGNNNRIAQMQNCVTATNPCDGASNSAQNVVTSFAFDALNHLVDTYVPMPGCAPGISPVSTASCVPAPTCSMGPPPTCTYQVTPCPATTCADDHIVYDTTGRVAQQIANYGGTQDVSQANVTTTFAYDADGRVIDTFAPITSASLQSGQIDERRVHDVLGRLVSDIKAYAVPTWIQTTTQSRVDYTLDLGGRVVSVTGPGTGSVSQSNRIVTTTDYDALGRPLYVTAASGSLNAISRTVYDPRGARHDWTPPTQQLAAGLETTTNYDLAGHAISVVRDDGTGGLHLTTSTTYDGYGRATDISDPRGIDTNTSYDALDRLASVTQNYCPSGNSNPNCNGSGILPDQNLTKTYVFDLAGNQTQVINPRSITEFTAYDALGRTLLVTKNCLSVPTPPATSCGTQSSDQNVTNSQTFDQAGDLLTTIDPLGRVNVYAYNALGRKTSATQNCVTVTNPCDGAVTSGQNLVTQWQVDAQGNVLQVRSPRQCTSAAPCYVGAPPGSSLTDGANLATGYTYDGLMRLASVIEDQSHTTLSLVTRYTYDPSGNKLSQTDGRTYATSYTVDNLSRVTKVTDANSNPVQTNYSLAGEVVSTINARGKTNANTLDRVGRLTGVSYFKADGTTQLTQSFGYDADGNTTSFSDTDVAQSTVTYDHVNRVSTVAGPSPACPTATSYTTTYTYFLDGAVNTICDATGTTTFAEDHLGQVATMLDPLTAGTTTYTFDTAGRLTGRTEANGIVTTVGYTGTDQLASKTEVAGSTTLASWTSINYDLAQNRTGETLTYYASNPYPDPQAGTAIYKYDTVNQLSQSSIPGQSAAAFGFDAAHNLTSNAGTTQAYNNNESLQTVGTATIGSDADGNQQKDVSGNSLNWNSLSQLESYSTTETYTYDAIGRLTKVKNGGSVTTQFVYQGVTGHVVQELNGSGSVIRSYARDTMGRQLYAKIGANVYYLITDPHGNVAALANATALVGTTHFDPWGNAFTPNGTTTPFGFQGSAGSWTDSTSGFVNMGMRWYYPKVGRFLSSDPAAGTADPRTPMTGLRWLYAIDNPLRYLDPNGLVEEVGGGDGSPPPAALCDRNSCGDGSPTPINTPNSSTSTASTPHQGNNIPGSRNNHQEIESDGAIVAPSNENDPRRVSGNTLPCDKLYRGVPECSLQPGTGCMDVFVDPSGVCDFVNSPPTNGGPQGTQSGSIVTGFCAGGDAAAGGAVSVQTCQAYDGTEQGHLGTVGVGVGTPGAGIGGGFMIAIAHHVHDLAGPFNYVTCNVGGVSVNVFWGSSPDGDVKGATVEAGPGIPGCQGGLSVTDYNPN